jgi:hypothetical protein
LQEKKLFLLRGNTLPELTEKVFEGICKKTPLSKPCKPEKGPWVSLVEARKI